jgi:hypothetical protein
MRFRATAANVAASRNFLAVHTTANRALPSAEKAEDRKYVRF